MDDYDYCDSLSGTNSFRARSNTWPLNRPDFAAPASASACVDDTLPEIDLEDDDLFTTADNWTAVDLVDHDPMSWDPILNGPPQMLENSSSNTNNLNHTTPTSSTTLTSANPGSQQLHLQSNHTQLQQLHLGQHSYQQQQQHLHHNGVADSLCTQQHQTQIQQPPPPPPPQFSPNNNNNNNNNNNSNNSNNNSNNNSSNKSKSNKTTSTNNKSNNNNNDSTTINGQANTTNDQKTLTPASAKLEPFNNDQSQQPQLLQQQHLSQSQHQIMPTVNGKAKLNTPRRNAWGNMSYADLISQAINSTDDKRLTLSQIYDWMVQNVPYFKDKGDSNSSAGWKNSVRHNLSLHNRFKRIQNEGTGKSSWWIINPEATMGKCARRRAASMEASRYEKKRGRAKKRVEAIRNGIISYPSLTDSSLTDSFSTEQLNLPAEAISTDNLHTQTTTMLHISQPPQHQTDSYYQQIPQHHQLVHHHQQPPASNDRLDMVGHTVYMTEPCNDCNCPEIMNCTNALSLL